MKTLLIATWMLSFPGALLIAEEPWVIESTADWSKAQASAKGITVDDDTVVLDKAVEGQWTSKWHSWQDKVDSVKVVVDAKINLFDNKTIEVLVDGSEAPFTNAAGTSHDWYGRCMIAILDENRWIMAFRSGVNHIEWAGRDAIHIITSNDEGRTWSKLDRWFDGTSTDGMPFEDGATHSETGLYRMPNGDLVLQFWRTNYSTGTRQLRSTDDGKTWKPDVDRISVVGVAGADDDRVIGTEDWFIDPENPSDVYMAFQYFHYDSQSGTLLARTRDDGKSYKFLSWIGPLADDWALDSGATFEPAIEYVGNRTIVAVMRHASGNRYTWQSTSTDMGRSFSKPVDISDQVNGGVENGLWQRVRLYKDSNPIFQHGNRIEDYAAGKGRLWGFGLHSNAGGYTRKPVVYWSDDNGQTWHGPQLLHGKMRPGTDTGYGDLKRRVDNTYVGAAYYATRDSKIADLEQYTFGGGRARLRIEVDRDADGTADAGSQWFEVCDGRSSFSPAGLRASRWRFQLQFRSTDSAGSPRIQRVRLRPDG
jgi:hypothetical protein